MQTNRFNLEIWLISIILLFCASCQQQAEQKSGVVSQEIQPSKVTEATQKPLVNVEKLFPKISFENKVCNLGEIGVREGKKCEFRFKNTGGGLLKIGKINSTCGCTVPSLSKKEYKPGQQGIITVRYHSSSKSGSISKRITVNTNDKKKPKVNLTVRAKVVQYVEVTPTKLKLLLGKENGGISTLKLRSKDGKAFSIKDCTAKRNLIKVDFDPNVAANEFVLKPTFNMRTLQKYRNGRIMFNLTHPACKLVTLPYTVVAKFQAQPSRITLNNAEPNMPQTKELLIKNTNKEHFEIESISSTNGYVEVLSQQPEGETIRLKLKITPPDRKTKARHFLDKMQIKIKNDETLIIGCTGFYRREADKTSPRIKS